jgi:HEAT repeat protein
MQIENLIGDADRDIFVILAQWDRFDALAAKGEQIDPALFDDLLEALLATAPKTRLAARAVLCRIEREMEFFEIDSERLRPLIQSLVYDPDLAACSERLAQLLPTRVAQAH